MKKNSSLLLVAAVAGLGFLNQAMAHESLLSPRAQALFPAMGHARAETRAGDPDLVKSQPFLGTLTKSQAARNTVGASAGQEPNLIQRPLYTGKDPIRELRGERFQVAPSVTKGKDCEAGCTKDCCAKK
jgi:hypothetical protein